MSLQDMYSCIINSNPQGQGVKIKENGQFIVRNTQISVQESQNELGTLWVIEFKIVRTSLPDEHPIGADRSLVHWPMRNRSHPGAIKNHIMASLGVPISGCDDFHLTTKEMQGIAEDNLLENYHVSLTTKRRTSKEGRDYCLHIWAPVEPGKPGCDVEL